MRPWNAVSGSTRPSGNPLPYLNALQLPSEKMLWNKSIGACKLDVRNTIWVLFPALAEHEAQSKHQFLDI